MNSGPNAKLMVTFLRGKHHLSIHVGPGIYFRVHAYQTGKQNKSGCYKSKCRLARASTSSQEHNQDLQQATRQIQLTIELRGQKIKSDPMDNGFGSQNLWEILYICKGDQIWGVRSQRINISCKS